MEADKSVRLGGISFMVCMFINYGDQVKKIILMIYNPDPSVAFVIPPLH